MKITAVFWYLWSTRLVFSVPQLGYHHYDPAKLEINQDPKAHDASRILPYQVPTHQAYKDPATIKLLLPRKPAAPGSEAHDASKNLPHQVPSAAPAYKDPVTIKLLLPRKPAALDSEAHDASKNLPHQVPSAAPAYKDPVTIKLLLPRKPAAPNHISSDVSDNFYDEESHLYSDEDDRDSLYPEAAEEYVPEDEVSQANDETDLTGDFQKEDLSNEDLDETE